MFLRIRRKMQRDGMLGLVAAVIKYVFRPRRRRAYKAMLELDSPKDRFAEIYKSRLWSSAESRSGEGSEFLYTASLRPWLIEKINSLEVKTFVDVPCGDFNWMQHVVKKVNINYTGLDIVDEVIDQNKAAYSSDKIKFEVADICKDRLPKCDIIMVRDCLFHLSFEDINRFLCNLSRMDFQYLLTSTHIVEPQFKNLDIKTGDFRFIDLFGAPFFFDRNNIEARVNDFPKYFPVRREMILVKKEFVPVGLSKSSQSKIF